MPSPPKSPWLGLAVAWFVLTQLVVGCGPSQDDLMQRAAMRRRSDPSEDVDAATTQTPAAKPDGVAASPSVEAREVASVNEKAGEVGLDDLLGNPPAGSDEARGAVSPPVVSEVPAEPTASEIEVESIVVRRGRPEYQQRDVNATVAQNLFQLAEAFESYKTRTGRDLPQRAIRNRQGSETLSWRVELLPDLGYPNLYSRFDPDKAWNLSPNKELIAYIPDVYVAPHRPDAKTNLLACSARGALFANGGNINDDDSPDGPENSLLIVEVNDPHAKPWTAPQDYDVSTRDFAGGIGQLRPLGTFAMWGNFLPTLIAKSASVNELTKAASSTDGNRAIGARLHNSIVKYMPTDDLLLSADNSSSPADTNLDAPTAKDVMPATERSTGPAGVAGETEPRDNVPPGERLTTARRSLQRAMGDRLRRATTLEQRADLADEMLAMADDAVDEPANQYVLAKAVLSMAVSDADLRRVFEAADVLTSRFEVDAAALLSGAVAKMSDRPRRSGDLGDADRSNVNRLILLAHHLAVDDRYAAAEKVVRFAATTLDSYADQELKAELGRLAVQVERTGRQFDEVQEVARDYGLGQRTAENASKLGTFYCFYKGDWEAGLPMLANGGSARLKELATDDLRGAVGTEPMVRLGDQWFELANQAKAGIYRDGSRARALHWYDQALQDSPGSLVRKYLERRFEENAMVKSANLLGGFAEIANQLAIDLTGDLTGPVRGGGRLPATRSGQAGGGARSIDFDDRSAG